LKATRERKPLAEVCLFLNGLWKGEKPPLVNVGVIRNTNFTKEGDLNQSDVAYLDVEAKKFAKRRLQFGDIILEKSGGGPKQPVGRVALFDIAEGDFSFSNFTSALRVLEPEKLDFRFLHKFLHWTYLSGITEGMQSHSTGIRNLDGGAYKAIEIEFPEMSEQRRIVGILDEAFDGIATAKANAERNLQNARSLFEAYLQSVLAARENSWSEKALIELCSLFFDSAHRTPDYQLDGIPALRPRDVVNGKLSLAHAARVSESEYEIQSKRHQPAPGDIVYSRELSYGWAALLPESPQVCLSQGMCVFRAANGVESRYLLYVLNGATVRKQAIAAAVGAAHPHINLGNIKAFKIPIPSLERQKEIVRQLDGIATQIERLESIYQKKLSAFDSLKQSFLQYAFEGSL
jgi:type I restriction enzyme, S subunit